MIFDVLTLFPEMIESCCSYSILKRAVDKDILSVNTINPRDFTLDKHKKVDDTPYGGGAGMVLMAQPYVDAYESIEKNENSVTVMLSPQGEPLTDSLVNDLAKYEQIVMLCGHYEGFDERIKTIVDEEISIGEFVLTGGEIPAMAITDAITRLIPGVINEESLQSETFTDDLVDYPVYTKPANFRGMEVPSVLLSGHHANIKKWREEKRQELTKKRNEE